MKRSSLEWFPDVDDENATLEVKKYEKYNKKSRTAWERYYYAFTKQTKHSRLGKEDSR